MKKLSSSIIFGLSVMGFNLSAVAEEPTRMFSLEQGATAEQGSISIDLYDSVKSNQQVRAGIWSGEVVISRAGVGYKRVIMPDLAVYGLVGIDTAEGKDSTFLAGGSYSLMLDRNFSVTANFELGTAGIDNDLEFGVGVGAYVSLPDADELGEIKLGGELVLSSADNTEAAIQLGARWMPRENITIDLLVFNNDTSKETDGALQTPAGIRVNLSF
ncbi:MAG: hypothetical protein L3J70_05425 [Gammaproteobacteria bacterium]|nr:hypothetical protein [Gammaproteobacteria bacterium]